MKGARPRSGRRFKSSKGDPSGTFLNFFYSTRTHLGRSSRSPCHVTSRRELPLSLFSLFLSFFRQVPSGNDNIADGSSPKRARTSSSCPETAPSLVERARPALRDGTTSAEQTTLKVVCGLSRTRALCRSESPRECAPEESVFLLSRPSAPLPGPGPRRPRVVPPSSVVPSLARLYRPPFSSSFAPTAPSPPRSCGPP